MGLDNFMDIDVDEDDTSESIDEPEDESPLDKHDNWTRDEQGNLKRRGPYGYSDREEYEDTIKGELNTHGDQFKYHLPIFPQIEIEERYNRGDRYKHDNSFKPVSCIAYHTLPLYKVNREVIMLDTGHTEKEECLRILSERFGREVTPKTEVHLYIFAYMRHIVKMGMAGEFTDGFGLEEKDRVLKAVYDEAYTQRFREKDTGESDLRHGDEIKEW
jgi:hypothetical protein